jgi:hypothetical protein
MACDKKYKNQLRIVLQMGFTENREQRIILTTRTVESSLVGKDMDSWMTKAKS